MEMQEGQLLDLLRRTFGLNSFRPFQMEAVQSILNGQDTLVILPTGGGKSLTYQLPPLTRDYFFTVVVSPLLALMKDQLEKCQELDIDARFWNCTATFDQKQRILKELRDPELSMKILFTTPEGLQQEPLKEGLKEAHENGTICSFALDEAHCISEWGHDFRPAYLTLCELKQLFPTTPILALTDLVQFIQARPGEGGIIYARLRNTCDSLCSELNARDLDVACYHAGKDADHRSRVQHAWAHGDSDVVVATIAFGMGIDRADVRWVVHWNVPTSMEGFYQESGRAGRDGKPSLSVMYVSHEDLKDAQKFEKGSRRGAIAAVADYCLQPGCRRKKVLQFFDEKRGGCTPSCEVQCDYCAAPRQVAAMLSSLDHAMEAKAATEAARLGQNADSVASPAPTANHAAWEPASAQRHMPSCSAGSGCDATPASAARKAAWEPASVQRTPASSTDSPMPGFSADMPSACMRKGSVPTTAHQPSLWHRAQQLQVSPISNEPPQPSPAVNVPLIKRLRTSAAGFKAPRMAAALDGANTGQENENSEQTEKQPATTVAKRGFRPPLRQKHP